MKTTNIATITVQDSAQSKDMLLSVLDNQPGTALDIVLLNAGAAIYVAGVTESLEQGVEKARMAVKRGLAREKLQELVEFTNKKTTLNREEHKEYKEKP